MSKKGWIGLITLALALTFGRVTTATAAPTPEKGAPVPEKGAPVPEKGAPDRPALRAGAAADQDDKSRRGGWLELKYGLPLSGGGWYGGGTGGPRLVGGYRFGRVILGLELGASYSQYDATPQTASGATSRWTTVLAQPVVQVILLSGWTWEIFGQAGVGVVYSLARLPDSGYRSDALGLVAHATAGARVFVHPRFGLGVELGVTGAYTRGSDRAPDTAQGESRSASVNLYAALGLAVRL